MSQNEQDHLKRELEILYPDIPLTAEEKENKDLFKEGKYWILDPIDGTTNLIHHFGMSAVALGLYEAGEITFGVVYNPGGVICKWNGESLPFLKNSDVLASTPAIMPELLELLK